MLGGAVELAVNLSVTHDFLPSVRRKPKCDLLQVGFLRSPVLVEHDPYSENRFALFRDHAVRNGRA
jgi:hypothetical protein